MKFEEACKECLKIGVDIKFRRIGSSHTGIRDNGGGYVEFFNIMSEDTLDCQLISRRDLEDDWQLIEEKETLSNKIIKISCGEESINWLKEEDAKETLKEYFKREDKICDCGNRREIRKELFGKRLL